MGGNKNAGNAAPANAAEPRRTEMVKPLLNRGADVKAKDVEDRTAPKSVAHVPAPGNASEDNQGEGVCQRRRNGILAFGK